MFEKKRNSIIKVIIILLILVSVSVLVNIPSVSANRWRYQYTTEDVYNITQSSDDAVAVIDNYFSSSEESITLKTNIYDVMIGLRFDNIDLVDNSTHSYMIQNAYLSLYSDQMLLSYEAISGKISIYFEIENYDIQTFSNYTELISRSPSYNYKNWDLDDVHGERTIGRWNDSPNLRYLVANALSFDNDTICFLMYSDRGVWFRYFLTYDHFVDFAPRLHIIYDVYEFVESPPDGYDEFDFVEEYEGFDIWWYEGVDDENRTGKGANVNWNILSLLDLTEQDSGSDLTVNNETWVTVDSMPMGVSDSLYNDSLSVDTYFLRFKVNITDVEMIEGGANTPVGSLYGLSTIEPSSTNGLSYGVSGNWVGLIVIADNDDETYCIRIKERAGLVDWTGDDTLYFDVSHNIITYWEVYTDMSEPNPYTRYSFYNDANFTDLNTTNTHIHALVSGSMRYPQTIASSGTAGSSFMSGEYYTFLESQLDIDGSFIVVDEDGNVIIEIDDDATIEDIEDWIDNYLGASPEYDKSPWMGDFTLLLVGLLGIAFIPLGFLIFVSSVRDGDIIGGLQTLVIMFFIGIGCIVTWLWA